VSRSRASHVAHCFGCGREVGVWQATFNRGALGQSGPKLTRHLDRTGRRCSWSGYALDPTAVMDAKEAV
jgi:hypothetical protein